MKKLSIICLIAILLTISGCNGNSREASSGQLETEKPIVVATIFPVADLVRQIGGEGIEVLTLLPPGASPHTFEPTPREMKAISHARLLISVGAGLDIWGQKLARTVGTDLKEIVITETLTLLPLIGHEHDNHQGEENHEKDSGDPHVWVDPYLVKTEIAPQIAEALAIQWPELTSTFQANLATLQRELAELDRELQTVSPSFTEKGFISFHSTWNYLGHRYGLREVASVLEYPGQEPSARWLAELTKMAKQEQVKTIFIEPQFNPRPAELLADEIGGKVFTLDPLGGEGVEGRSTYIELMGYNLRVLKEALQ